MTLSGTLEIDVTDLLDEDFSSGNGFVLISSLKEIEGELPIFILTGRDDLYGRLTKKKGGLGIPAELLAITGHRGDADNQNAGVSWRVLILPFVEQQPLYNEIGPLPSGAAQSWEAQSQLPLLYHCPAVNRN